MNGRLQPLLDAHSDFVAIPAGSFLMGSADGSRDEQPVHEVLVDAFALAVHPVTNAEYHQFLTSTGLEAASFDDPRFQRPRQPIVAVNWFDAVAYCEWLAGRIGLPCRLPTEAEREKASRGGATSTACPSGVDPRMHEHAPSCATPAEVGSGTANGYGLHHMGDLVHEWCSDWYDADYYRASPRDNPIGPASGTRRASRGGSWRHQVPITRCAARSSLPPDRRYNDYGFRVAIGGTAARYFLDELRSG